MSVLQEAVLERNLLQFVLSRTAEPVYLELRDGLILIRHLSRYGSNILAAFWARVLQHPNNYPGFRYPYRKLYDTKGLWKIALQLDDVVITIFTKTGTMTMKGPRVLEWFVDRFQGIMDAVDAPIQAPQPIQRLKYPRNSDSKASQDPFQSNSVSLSTTRVGENHKKARVPDNYHQQRSTRTPSSSFTSQREHSNRVQGNMEHRGEVNLPALEMDGNRGISKNLIGGDIARIKSAGQINNQYSKPRDLWEKVDKPRQIPPTNIQCKQRYQPEKMRIRFNVTDDMYYPLQTYGASNPNILDPTLEYKLNTQFRGCNPDQPDRSLSGKSESHFGSSDPDRMDLPSAVHQKTSDVIGGFGFYYPALEDNPKFQFYGERVGSCNPNVSGPESVTPGTKDSAKTVKDLKFQFYGERVGSCNPNVSGPESVTPGTEDSAKTVKDLKFQFYGERVGSCNPNVSGPESVTPGTKDSAKTVNDLKFQFYGERVGSCNPNVSGPKSVTPGTKGSAETVNDLIDISTPPLNGDKEQGYNIPVERSSTVTKTDEAIPKVDELKVIETAGNLENETSKASLIDDLVSGKNEQNSLLNIHDFPLHYETFSDKHKYPVEVIGACNPELSNPESVTSPTNTSALIVNDLIDVSPRLNDDEEQSQILPVPLKHPGDMIREFGEIGIEEKPLKVNQAANATILVETVANLVNGIDRTIIIQDCGPDMAGQKPFTPIPESLVRYETVSQGGQQSLRNNNDGEEVAYHRTLEDHNYIIKKDLEDLNRRLKTQQLDVWTDEALDSRLEALSIGSVQEGGYVYTLWKSLLEKFLSNKSCKVYIASPYMDQTRLLDVCHAFLRNRLTACVDSVFIKRHTESGQLISELKRNSIREFPAREQAILEYKLYSSFIYPFVNFHYRFLAGVIDGSAYVLLTSADFNGNHFESDGLEMVTYLSMTEDNFRSRFINPLTK